MVWYYKSRITFALIIDMSCLRGTCRGMIQSALPNVSNYKPNPEKRNDREGIQSTWYVNTEAVIKPWARWLWCLRSAWGTKSYLSMHLEIGIHFGGVHWPPHLSPCTFSTPQPSCLLHLPPPPRVNRRYRHSLPTRIGKAVALLLNCLQPIVYSPSNVTIGPQASPQPASRVLKHSLPSFLLQS